MPIEIFNKSFLCNGQDEIICTHEITFRDKRISKYDEEGNYQTNLVKKIMPYTVKCRPGE